MTTLNNLEKLIQMATIEQMYGMIQKMRDEFSHSSLVEKACNADCSKACTNESSCFKQSTTEPSYFKPSTTESSCFKPRNELNTDCIETCKSLEERISKLEKTNAQLMALIGTLTAKVSTLENTTVSEPSYEQKSIPKGQQLLTAYLSRPKEEEHIKLKIVEVVEEKTIPNINVIEDQEEELVEEEPDTKEQEEEEVVADEQEEEELVVDEEPDSKEEEEELVVDEEPDSKEEEEELVVDEEEEQEVVEEEPDTKEEVDEVEESDESEADSEEEVRTNDEIEEVPTLDVKNEEEEGEEEEEVFEIEIDDVTYFATDEENGILYAVTDDGDIGEKVGILKDGEPIFT
jgi:hypothetical protein